MRYWIVVTMCRLLRHPARRTEYAGGTAWTRCPCGYIEISDRAFNSERRP